jgi:hypothetical protein
MLPINLERWKKEDCNWDCRFFFSFLHFFPLTEIQSHKDHQVDLMSWLPKKVELKQKGNKITKQEDKQTDRQTERQTNKKVLKNRELKKT